MLVVNLSAKFRAFGFTFGSWGQPFNITVPPEALAFAAKLAGVLKYDGHGVKLVSYIL